MRPGLGIDAATLPPLHRAAFEADVLELTRVLAARRDPDEPNVVSFDECLTPLMLAAASTSREATEAIRVLLAAGANPRLRSTRGAPVLWFAESTGNVRGMRRLLEAGAPPTGICEAAEAGNVNAVRLLLHFGASPHPVASDDDDGPVEPAYAHRIPLFAAAEGGSAACIRLLIGAGARVNTIDIGNRNALMYASSAEAVRALVAAGCSLGWRDLAMFDIGEGVVERAAANGHEEALLELVACGADINGCGGFGQTPLVHYCSASVDPSPKMIQTLLEAGAYLHSTWWRGRTALHEAPQVHIGDRFGKLSAAIRTLVEAGLDVNVRDDQANTPLHYAVGDEGMDLDALKTLLELGADPALKNDRGETAADIAWQWHQRGQEAAEAERLMRRFSGRAG